MKVKCLFSLYGFRETVNVPKRTAPSADVPSVVANPKIGGTEVDETCVPVPGPFPPSLRLGSLRRGNFLSPSSFELSHGKMLIYANINMKEQII